MKKHYLLLALVILIFSACNRGESDEVQTINEVEETAFEWQIYQNKQLDFTFDYPANWQLSQDMNIVNESSFWSRFDASGQRILIFGINDQYIHEGPASNIEGCAIRYKSIDEFCENACEKISDNIALKYQATKNGDLGYGLYAYTDISTKYPSTCIELDISQVLYEIAEENGIKYNEVLQQYDVESMIENREVSDSILHVVDDFKSFLETIRL